MSAKSSSAKPSFKSKSKTPIDVPESAPSKRLFFKKSQALQSRPEFQRVFKDGRKVVSGPFVVYGAKREDPDLPSRLGLAVSRRFGNAVRRNRARRMIRESFRLYQWKWPRGYDWIVIPRGHGFPKKMPEVAAGLERALLRISSHQKKS